MELCHERQTDHPELTARGHGSFYQAEERHRTQLGTSCITGGFGSVRLQLRLLNTSHYIVLLQLCMPWPNLRYWNWNFPCLKAGFWNFSWSGSVTSKNEVKRKRERHFLPNFSVATPVSIPMPCSKTVALLLVLCFRCPVEKCSRLHLKIDCWCFYVEARATVFLEGVHVKSTPFLHTRSKSLPIHMHLRHVPGINRFPFLGCKSWVRFPV